MAIHYIHRGCIALFHCCTWSCHRDDVAPDTRPWFRCMCSTSCTPSPPCTSGGSSSAQRCRSWTDSTDPAMVSTGSWRGACIPWHWSSATGRTRWSDAGSSTCPCTPPRWSHSRIPRQTPRSCCRRRHLPRPWSSRASCCPPARQGHWRCSEWSRARTWSYLAYHRRWHWRT